MDFSPKPGCPLCGIVAAAAHTTPASPRTPAPPPPGAAAATAPDVLWRDDNFTVYRERTHPVSSAGHIVFVFNLHVPSIYSLSSSDIPLLTTIKALAHRLLGAIDSDENSRPSSPTPTSASFSSPRPLRAGAKLRVGFVTPPFKDPKLPVSDHLHAHAFLEPADRLGWWRAVAYSPLAWYALDDLVAEIRESTSNNRIKSGYADRARAPIDSVPHAGARAGTAFGHELTEPGVASADLEAADGPAPRRPHTPVASSSASPASSRASSLMLSPPPALRS